MSGKVVIPYVKSGTNELEYALKSLKNINHSGYEVLESENRNISPYLDVHTKLQEYLRNADEEETILMMDDVFIMKPIKLQLCFRGSLKDHINERSHNDRYTRALIDTYEWLRSMGIEEPLSFELHVPFLMQTRFAQMTAELIRLDMQKGKNILIRSVYGNFAEECSGIRSDCKNIDDYKDKSILSTNHHTWNGEMGAYIRDKLDEK